MNVAPDSSAVRIALWRALHVEIDGRPSIIDDTIGLELAAPNDGWRERGDMHAIGTGPYRAGIVARTRFVEDLVIDEHCGQYVLLGAGLDTFAQRHLSAPSSVEVFEIDQPGPQEWKRQRLLETGYGIAPHLHLVPVDFESGDDWWQALGNAGFDVGKRVLVYSSGVSMYITKEATAQTLRTLGRMASGSVVVMTFMLPLHLADEADRPGLEGAARGARASGTPWISFFEPEEIVTLARHSGFVNVSYVSTLDIAHRYLDGRTDGLRAASGEGILLAQT